jgi:hypothetical protein
MAEKPVLIVDEDTLAERFDLGRLEPIGQICMEGEHLVRHHLQQALLAAEFLPGGENHDSVMSAIVTQIYLTDADAAEAVRADLRLALAAIGGDEE